MDAIRTEGLSRSFGGTAAVDGLTLSVERGEIFGLVGPDGAGKTTTMRLLAAILEPTAGDAWILGHSVRSETGEVHRRIGYMSQRFGLYADLTVSENLSFYADLHGLPRQARGSRIEELLEFSGLGPFRRRRAGNLSGGMQQKLSLSCALVHTPEVLLLDEPTSGVDPVSRRDFWRILRRLSGEGVTIFVSTSYLDEAESCGRVGLLHRGKILAAKTPWEVRTLFRGTVLEIRCRDVTGAAAALRSAFPGGSLGLYGGRVRFLLRNSSAAPESAGAALAAAGIPFDSVEPVSPSLEDAFVSLLREGSGEAV